MSGDLVDPPATVLAGEVPRLLDRCAPVVAAHSERSYQFAAALAAADGVELDEEVLYLGTMLHDVGLSSAVDGSERFEVRGANLVRELLREHGMEPDRIGNVWDCIAMHASTELARHKSPETRYANRGIAMDVRSAGVEALDPTLVRAVLDGWPRHDFPTEFEAVLAEEVRAHPDSVRMSWLESVAMVHVPGFVPTDFLAALRASDGFV
ncbi:MAG TPA: HD domain-containing protein [Ilumatobacter sp.]|nr:HD domain-containing protein [Ilumatobacter sp.]